MQKKEITMKAGIIYIAILAIGNALIIAFALYFRRKYDRKVKEHAAK